MVLGKNDKYSLNVMKLAREMYIPLQWHPLYQMIIQKHVAPLNFQSHGKYKMTMNSDFKTGRANKPILYFGNFKLPQK